ncbi:hypothetical protein TNCV_1890181 [Trichonephila clavipes]|nr:hypothetical protein TNCV_1890181 [Trichonephila clavipes]
MTSVPGGVPSLCSGSETAGVRTAIGALLLAGESWCDVERFGRKPCCSGMIRLIESTCGGTFLLILFSRQLCRELREVRSDESYLLSSGLSQALGWVRLLRFSISGGNSRA